MWRIFGPLVIKGCVAFGVELVVMSLYLTPYVPELMEKMTSWDEYVQRSTELSIEFFSKYATQVSALAALFTIPILMWMFKRDRKQERLQAQEQESPVLERKVPLWKYIMVIGVSLPFALGLNNLLMLSNLAELSEAYQEASKTLYTPAFPVQILCLGIIIPIMEELIFRGLIFKRVRMEAPFVRSMIYSALFFGLYHGNTVQIIYGILSGMLFAYLYEKYNSFKAPALAHMAMNIMVCTVTEFDGFIWMFEQPMRLGIITVACAAIASSVFVLIREKV